MKNAFAVWVVPQHIIMCEKPSLVIMNNGMVTDLEFTWKLVGA